MIRIDTGGRTLSESTRRWLEAAQMQIRNQSDHLSRVKFADQKWNSRNKKAFQEIISIFKNFARGIEKCAYCESNEAKVIDHIAPKSQFPSLAFDWENFVFACDQCNTHAKRDRFAVFHPAGSDNAFLLQNRSQEMEPPSLDFAFIHPRREDPMEFLQLNLLRGIFEHHPKIEGNARDLIKARNTLQILGLNDRATLKGDRRNAVGKFVSQLSDYQNIDLASDISELKQHLRFPDDKPSSSKHFFQVKERALRILKKRILQSSHITVLHEMGRQSARHPELLQFQETIAKILQ
jgi:uncharacterized protein (TIGR02646 family)